MTAVFVWTASDVVGLVVCGLGLLTIVGGLLFFGLQALCDKVRKAFK